MFGSKKRDEDIRRAYREGPWYRDVLRADGTIEKNVQIDGPASYLIFCDVCKLHTGTREAEEHLEWHRSLVTREP